MGIIGRPEVSGRPFGIGTGGISMGKQKSKTWSPRPATTQSGVLNYNDVTAKKRRLSGKTKRRRALARTVARNEDAIRQLTEQLNGTDLDLTAELLREDPRLTLAEAKELSRRYNGVR
jgi:ABC-type thiamine transport system ATPase subunit